MEDTNQKKSKRNLLIAWIISCLAVLDSVWLLVIHLQGDVVGGLCNVASNVSCSILGIKSYSEWFGIPVPVFSILFYGFIAAFLFKALRAEGAARTRPLVYGFWFSIGSVLVSVYFAYVSFFLLKTLCPFCFVLYVLSILMAVFVFLEYRKIVEPWGHLIRYDLKNFYRRKEVWIAGLLSLVFLGGAYFLPRPGSDGELSNEKVTLASVESRTLGNQSAAVTVAEFSDFRCPYCRIAGEVLKELEKDLRGKVKIVYRFFPLDASCNPLGGGHTTSCEAAYAAYCAGAQDRFWVVHDLIYMAQGGLSRSVLYQIASQAGLNLGAFEACLEAKSTKEAVLKDIEEGVSLKLKGTPSIFVNGRRYQGPLTVEGLRAAVLKELG